MIDALAWRAKIGIVMPSTNTAVQPECDAMRPRGVTNHVARISIKERPLNTLARAFLLRSSMIEGVRASRASK